MSVSNRKFRWRLVSLYDTLKEAYIKSIFIPSAYKSISDHFTHQLYKSLPLSTLKMSKLEWIGRLKNMVKKSPLYSNFVIGFVMVVLEQLVEIDFACPCNPKLNLLFSMAYFVVPALFSFALLFYIQSSQIINYSSCLHCALVCLTPAVLWIMLLFFDGQYFACAKTSWEGLTVHTDITASTTWCQPLSERDNTTEKQMSFFNYRNNSQVSMMMKSKCCYKYVVFD